MKEKKNLLKTIALVVITVIAGNIGPRLFNIITKQPLNNSNTLKGRVMIMNKDCPFVIDENTRLDSVTLLGKNIVQNNYTLLNERLTDIDIDAFKSIMKPEIIRHLKSKTETDFFRDKNTTLMYKYFDKEKQFVTDISILPKDYLLKK